jgi:hypothetical protein
LKYCDSIGEDGGANVMNTQLFLNAQNALVLGI